MKRVELHALLERHGIELVIGLETHIRLNTKSKLFCSCANEENEQPNVNICPICTGQMGTLPSLNREALIKAIHFGKAIDCSFSNESTSWDRKHYEYPDNPKNIQITQFHHPIIPDGKICCYRNDGSLFVVDIKQVHIEEDAAKLIHEKEVSLVDFNKAGVPLIEVVTEPCIERIEDASIYMQYLHRIVQHLEISEANLEKGEFKSDVSISLRFKNTDALNPRTEIKNLNSFKFTTEALKEEIEKQLDFFLKNDSFRPDQSTVLWDEFLKKTRVMRKKEYDADYRYITEPDLPIISIKNTVDKIKIDKTTLPYAVETTLIQGGLLPQDAKFFTSDILRSKTIVSLIEEFVDVLFSAKILSNNLKIEDYKKIKNIRDFISIFEYYRKEEISPTLLQNAIALLLENPDFDYEKFFETHVISNDKIQTVIDQIISQNKDIESEIRFGNEGKSGVLVGKVLAEIGKKISGSLIRKLILKTILGEKKKSTEKKKNEKINNLDEISHQIPLVIKKNYKTHSISQIGEEIIKSDVILSGWVANIRDHGKLIFVDLRDASHEKIQIRFDKKTFPDSEDFIKLKPESVVSVSGKIIKRNEVDYNLKIKTGKIELDAMKIEILNLSKNLPFEIEKSVKTNETMRLQYKFLDHRNQEVRKVIIHRYKVIKLIRDLLDQQGFLEIETPILTSGTDEGAREFIVPFRKTSGHFYTLPQAPQQFKQMLMVGGFEKYFQIAKCFRDEDTRGDRQPEFTQLDMEMAYVSMEDVMNLNTELFNTIIKTIYSNTWILKPFERLSYKEAMEKYGSDKPDLRFDLQMKDITHIVKKTSFQVFSKPIENGGIVKCIKVSEEDQGKKRMSKGQIEKLTAVAQENGLDGLAYIIMDKNELQSPIIKFLEKDIIKGIIESTEAKSGDILYFSAADQTTVNKALSAVRQKLGMMLDLIPPNELRPVWIVDFPMFEKSDEGRWTFTHNPFSMPAIDDIEKHMEEKDIETITAQQYDLILNGYEIGGGSIRAHNPEILEATYKNMGYEKDEMLKSIGTIYKAFHYGAPPHGGIAWGIDRLMMILERKKSIREVIAFPKTGNSEDLLFNAPSALSLKKIEEMNITVTDKS